MARRIEGDRGKGLTFDSFPDSDDYLMVTWIRSLWRPSGSDTNPYIGVNLEKIKGSQYLSSCLDTENWDRYSLDRKSIFTNIRLSDLPLLTVGSVWKKKELIHELSTKHYKYHSLLILPMEKIERKIILQPDFLKSSEWSGRPSPCLHTYGYINNNKVEVYIPCAELARFYWGTSTTFFRDLIVNGIDDFSWFLEKRKLPISEKKWFVYDRELNIWMDAEYADIDALSFSRIIGDDEARRQASLMHRSLEVAAVKREIYGKEIKNDFYLQTGFPFSTGTKLHVFGKVLNRQNGIPIIFVLRIAQCFHKLSFRKVRIKRILLEAQQSEKQSEHGYIPTKHHRMSQNPEREIITNLEAHYRSPLQKSVINLDPFPNFFNYTTLKVERQKVRTLETLTHNVYDVDKDHVSGGYGNSDNSLVGRYRKEIKVKKEECVKDKNNKHNEEPQEQREIEPYFDLLVNAFNLLFSMDKSLKQWSVLVVENDKVEKSNKTRLTKFPVDEYGHKYAWTNMHNRREPRQCLWIECKWENYFLYFCEWERRKDNFAIYFLIWNGGERAFGSNLYNIMKKWAMKQQYRQANGLNDLGWYRWSIPHFHKKENENEYNLADKIKVTIQKVLKI